MTNARPRTRGLSPLRAVLACSLLPTAALATDAGLNAAELLAIPDRAGAVSDMQWLGQMPDGIEAGAHCQNAYHEWLLRVPAHELSAGQMRLVASVTPTGASAAATDVQITLVRPDGRAQSADARFEGGGESINLGRVEPGVWAVRACAVGGATPQAFQGKAQLIRLGEPENRPKVIRYVESAASTCEAPAAVPKFEQVYIDEGRAGGEPLIVKHPDGHMLWGSHAGTTHFYSPAAATTQTTPFVENYTGQTYYYYSEADDNYENWTFVPRQGPGPGDVTPLAGVPASGFSDPEFAFDSAGNVYVSEINLVNIAVSKSTDGGRSYGLQNVFAFSVSDRQWMAADRENELYMAASGFGGGTFPGDLVGELSHFVAKSVDGGVTWGNAFRIDPIVGDLQLDQQRGILYSLHYVGGQLSIARFPNIREEMDSFTVDILPIADITGVPSADTTIGPTFDLDDAGNLYATWPENGQVRPAGIYYAYSTDQGESWSQPQRIDQTPEDDLWPWIAVGEPGQVAIAWMQTNTTSNSPTPGEANAGSPADRLQGSPDKPWHVMVAISHNGLGCAGEDSPLSDTIAAFAVTQASDEPPHTGTVCQGGTLCQAQLIDRRIGDYFGNEVAADGTVHVAISDTRKGGAVALPLHIRQVDGPRLLGQPEPAPVVAAPRTENVAPVAASKGGGSTGLWALLALAASGLRRRAGLTLTALSTSVALSACGAPGEEFQGLKNADGSDTAIEAPTDGLRAGPALWHDPGHAPHPAFNFATPSHPPAAGAPAHWYPPAAPESKPSSMKLSLLGASPDDVPRAQGMTAFGSLVIAGGRGGAPGSIVDISNPQQPVLLSNFNHPSSRGADTIAYPDGRLITVIAGQGSGTGVFDITDPTNPIKLHALRPAQGPTHNIGVVPGTPIVYNSASHGGGNSPTGGSGYTEIWDLSDPDRPLALDHFHNGWSCHDIRFWHDVENSKFRAICAGVEFTQLWDTTDPRKPELIVSLPVHHGVPGTPSGAASPAIFSHFAALNADGTVLIVGDETGGGAAPGCTPHAGIAPAPGVAFPLGALFFYDVSDETDPLLQGWFAPHLQPLSNTRTVDCTVHFGRIVPSDEGRDLLAIGAYHAGTLLVDFTNPTTPALLDQYIDGTDTWEAWYHNGYVVTSDIARGIEVLALD